MVRIHVLEIETNGKIMNGGGVDGEIFVVDQDFLVGCQYGGLDTGFGLVVWWYHSDSVTVPNGKIINGGDKRFVVVLGK
jgi:hypothetical protein